MQYKNDETADLKFGFYRGVVLKHLSHGKLKVFIHGVYSQALQENPDALPDAEQMLPLFSGACKGNGMFSYPNIGAAVWCFFQNGDPNFPVVMGATLGGTLTEGQYDLTFPSNDTHNYRIVAGNALIQFDDAGNIKISGTSGQDYAAILMCSNGAIQIESTKQIILNAPSIIQTASDQYYIASPSETHQNAQSFNVQTPSTCFDSETFKVRAENDQMVVI